MEVCDKIDDDREEEEALLEAVTRTPFQHEDMKFSLARRRVTDMKGNSRVYFPRKARSLEEEATFDAKCCGKSRRCFRLISACRLLYHYSWNIVQLLVTLGWTVKLTK